MIQVRGSDRSMGHHLEKEVIRTWFLGKEGRALLAHKGFDISSLPSMEENAVNKSIVLMSVRFW